MNAAEAESKKLADAHAAFEQGIEAERRRGAKHEGATLAPHLSAEFVLELYRRTHGLPPKAK